MHSWRSRWYEHLKNIVPEEDLWGPNPCYGDNAKRKPGPLTVTRMRVADPGTDSDDEANTSRASKRRASQGRRQSGKVEDPLQKARQRVRQQQNDDFEREALQQEEEEERAAQAKKLSKGKFTLAEDNQLLMVHGVIPTLSKEKREGVFKRLAKKVAIFHLLQSNAPANMSSSHNILPKNGKNVTTLTLFQKQPKRSSILETKREKVTAQIARMVSSPSFRIRSHPKHQQRLGSHLRNSASGLKIRPWKILTLLPESLEQDAKPRVKELPSQQLLGLSMLPTPLRSRSAMRLRNHQFRRPATVSKSWKTRSRKNLQPLNNPSLLLLTARLLKNFALRQTTRLAYRDVVVNLHHRHRLARRRGRHQGHPRAILLQAHLLRSQNSRLLLLPPPLPQRRLRFNNGSGMFRILNQQTPVLQPRRQSQLLFSNITSSLRARREQELLKKLSRPQIRSVLRRTLQVPRRPSEVPLRKPHHHNLLPQLRPEIGHLTQLLQSPPW